MSFNFFIAPSIYYLQDIISLLSFATHRVSLACPTRHISLNTKRSFNSRERTAKSANNSKRETATTCAKHAANRKKKVNKRQKRLKATSCIEIESKDKLKAPSAGERAHTERAQCALLLFVFALRSLTQHSFGSRVVCRSTLRGFRLTALAAG